MEYFVIALLGVGALAFVASPLFSSKRYLLNIEDMFDLGDERQATYLNSRKQLVYENMRELDFEHEMGKLAEEDYSRLRRGYLMEAQDILRALERIKIKREIEDLIESDVRSRRRTQ